MEDSILSYYEQELTYIRQMGEEFARKYPKIAGRLLLEPDKSEDPHTERLIEAFAFISGRIHKKIDDDFPQITESLLNIIYPHYVNPIPSMTVVQFDPIMSSISEAGYEIDKNTKLFSKSVDGVPCQFRTRMPTHIWPVEVVSAGFEDPYELKNGAQQAIRIELKLANDLTFGDLEWQFLRFFLNGQSHQVYNLYELLLNNVCHIDFEISSRRGKPKQIELSPDIIKPVGFDKEETLIPFTSRSFPGYRILYEYFCFSEKFLFFDLNGFDKLKEFENQNSVSIWLHLDKVAKTNMVVDQGTFSLNCTTAINLFKKIAEPIRIEHQKTEYQIIPDLRRRNSTEIHSIEKVTASLGGKSGNEVIFKPFYSVRHHLGEGDDMDRRAHWHIQRRLSGRHGDKGTDIFLSFVDLDFKPTDPEFEILTVHTVCTNRDLPSRLPFGDPNGDFDLETAAPVLKTRCLLKPTPTRRVNLGGALQWRLISHFSLNYMSIVQGGEEALREILTLYDFDNSAATRQQINGIVSLESKHITKKIGPSICRGVKVTLELDKDKFVGAGLFLFASVLERLFGQYISVNSFSQLAVKISQSKEILKEWPPRSGNRRLL